MIVFTYFLAKNISVPIKELNTMSLQVAEGNVNVTVNENRGDEIGMLARSFNKMTFNIKNLLRELIQHGS